MRAMRGEYPSMETYADGLVAGLRETHPDIVEVEPKQLPNSGTLSKPARAINGVRRYIERFRDYPLRALATKPDVIHVISDHYFQVGRFHRPGIKVVATCHDLIFYRFRKNIEQFAAFVGISRSAQEFSMRSLPRCDHVITLSEDNVHDLHSILGVPRDRMTIIHNAVPAHFQPATPQSRIAARNALGLADSTFAIMHVGTVEPRKNVDAIIETMGLLKNDDVLFLKAGIEFTAAQSARIAALGIGPRIRHLGRIPNEKMVAIYHASDALIFPSLYEGFPFPVVESMASGTPVITSTASSLPETAGGAALLVDPHDPREIAGAVARLRDDATLRADRIAAGFSRVENLTWKKNAQAVGAIYLQLCGGRP
jgi:glycosyltransferase involved in cell wall biosynthesis